MGDNEGINIKGHISFWARVAKLLGLGLGDVHDSIMADLGRSSRREWPQVRTGGALAHQKWKRRRAAGWHKI